ncbi:flagellar hook capping FlgD N-terminal domain-containing protein [Sandarakinorhabdus sp.]|uniref:flagellar hook assembly protein FlgD n=1 Tax=Sandarakinorhabdus sp. TaxID=1916663 RepID=UPI00286E43C8|nr:flagellar hook capping FlgD N-terminal domain-containing protein [Sandarakinorhabdus sp.]
MSRIDTLPAGIPVAGPPAAKPLRQSLGQADFLELMTAQLKNQDPTKPVDNTEYVAQMAQFSTVNGIENMNIKLASVIDRLDALIAAQSAAAISATPEE